MNEGEREKARCRVMVAEFILKGRAINLAESMLQTFTREGGWMVDGERLVAYQKAKAELEAAQKAYLALPREQALNIDPEAQK